MNLYAYVGGNPVMYTDPWGLMGDGPNAEPVEMCEQCASKPVEKCDKCTKKMDSPRDLMNQAAIKALDKCISISAYQNLEYCGYVYSLGTVYGYTEPEQGERGDCEKGLVASEKNLPKGSKVVAVYHTHGACKWYGSNVFSTPDYLGASLRGKPLYLGNPNGDVILWIPGNINPPNWEGEQQFIYRIRPTWKCPIEQKKSY